MTYDRKVIKVDMSRISAAIGRREFPPAAATPNPD